MRIISLIFALVLCVAPTISHASYIGVVPVRLANGGTGTTTSFTQGSVVFAGSNGVYSQNNTGLFFDNSNLRLGVNKTSPTSVLYARDSTQANVGLVLEGLRGSTGVEIARQDASGVGEVIAQFGVNTGYSIPRSGTPLSLYMRTDTRAAENRFTWISMNAGSSVENFLMSLYNDSGVGNLGLNGGSFGGGRGVLFIANRSVVPLANPSGGGIIYVESGALKYRGSGGTVTTIANP